MVEQDKIKWNEKHEEAITRLLERREQPKPNVHLVQWINEKKMSQSLLCLDVASGLGGNSIYLAKKGFQVDAYDISDVAIRYLTKIGVENHLPIQAQVVDLDKVYQLPCNKYDLIMDTYFLNRSLFPAFKCALKPGALFFMETFYMTKQETNAHVPNEYKLSPNELEQEFSEWSILHFAQNETLGVQTILARKPEL
jgi:tellurite methyltransferase